MAINLEAENSLLGCILKDNELIKELSIESKHFYDASNQHLFEVMQEIDKNDDPIDVVTILTKTNNVDKKHLGDLLNSVASLEPFKTYERLIIESWKMRKAQEIKSRDISNVDDITQLMNELSELELQNNDDDYDHQAALVNLYQEIENQPEGLSGIDTGFKDLNRMLDGFQSGDLIISAARPSVGKTAKMLNHAIKHGEAGGIVAIFSLEMDRDSLNKRMLSTIGRIDGHKMRRPKQLFNADDWSNLTIAMGILSKMNIHIEDKAGQTVPFIRSKVKKLKRKFPDTPMLILIDYLQLIRSTVRHESKNIEVGEITRSLKELAKDTKSPVYLLSQLSRGVESRQDKRPMMSDIRDSGSIEQDADVIEFLYRDDYYNHDTEAKNIIEIIIAKQRNGAVGTVELAFIKEYNLFADLAYEH